MGWWPGSKNIQQQTRVVSALDKIAIKAAERIEAELKEDLSKEILQMRIEKAVFADLKLLITELKKIFERLKIADTYGSSVGHASVMAAVSELAALEQTGLSPGLLVKIEALLPAAIKVDAQKGNVARKIHGELAAMHNTLTNELNRIRTERKW